MLLSMLCRELRADLRDATLSWLSASHIGRAIRKRQCSIRSLRMNWKRSSPDNGIATVRSPDLLKKNSVPSWIAAFSRGAFCGFTARAAAGIGYWRSPVKRYKEGRPFVGCCQEENLPTTTGSTWTG